jgi:hypothetical protein
MPDSATSSAGRAAIRRHKHHRQYAKLRGARAVGSLLVHAVTSMQPSKHFELVVSRGTRERIARVETVW